MADKTKIEWTDATWNPIRGCTRVSEGCRNCYAEGVARRFDGEGLAYEGLINITTGAWNGTIKFVDSHLLDPLKWKTPRRIFVNSMSDLFHENVTDEMRDRIFAVMALCPQHTFQVLTKRPERMRDYLGDYSNTVSPSGFRCPRPNHVLNVAQRLACAEGSGAALDALDALTKRVHSGAWVWPLQNVWLGVSVENQKAADERIPLLLQTPAAVRFLSCEPLLGALDLRGYLERKCDLCGGSGSVPGPQGGGKSCPNCYDDVMGSLGWTYPLGWVIAGGESGPNARPMHPDWTRSLRDQCVRAQVPFFFKQWGEWKPISAMADGEADALYVPNKKAPKGEEWRQDDLNSVHGTRCTVPVSFLGYTGETDMHVAYQSVDGHGGMMFFKVGKKEAGDLLNGVEHHAFPEVR